MWGLTRGRPLRRPEALLRLRAWSLLRALNTPGATERPEAAAVAGDGHGRLA